MTLIELIVEALPELSDFKFFKNDVIILQNDSDGVGDYIAKWEYSQPIPNGLTLGKPTGGN